jgi:RNA polymerase sigma-70 factor (ECF subfamily)
MSDAQLLDQIARKDRESLRLLYRRHGRVVYGSVLRIVGDGPTAEEVTQDVFVKVWEKASTYRRDKASVLTWLLTMARNRAIDALRRRSPARVPRAWDLEVGQEPDPSEGFDLSEERKEVRRALAALGPDQRKALQLAFYQGKTHREIAAELKEPLGTVKTRIRDALLKLRNALSERKGQ